MLYTTLTWACTISSLAALLYLIGPALTGRPTVTLTSLCTYLLCMFVSFAVDLPICRGYVDQWLGMPNAATLIVQISVVILTFAQQITILDLTRDRPLRLIWWTVAGAVISLVVLITWFVVIAPDRTGPAQETVYLNLADPQFATYFAFYVTVCFVGRIQTVVFAFRYARTVDERHLRRGLWCIASGSALILAYCGVRYWQILALHTDGVPEPGNYWFWLLADVGTLLQIYGWIVPSWVSRVRAARRRFGAYRDYLRLAPLWQAIHDALPELTLEQPPARLLAWLPPTPLEYYLYRRIIEIRDGELILRQSADPAVLRGWERARGSPAEAEHEAAVIWSALCATNGTRRTADPEPATDPPPDRVPDGDVRQEIDALVRVSVAFRRISRGDRPRPADQDDGGWSASSPSSLRS